MLAKLFSKPANLLVLDEPTNDLDVETLELLEEVLLGFQGHGADGQPRSGLLDNVVTSTLVFQGGGEVREYVGGYQDWLRQGGSPRLLGVADSAAQAKGGRQGAGAAPAPCSDAGRSGTGEEAQLQAAARTGGAAGQDR